MLRAPTWRARVRTNHGCAGTHQSRQSDSCPQRASWATREWTTLKVGGKAIRAAEDSLHGRTPCNIYSLGTCAYSHYDGVESESEHKESGSEEEESGGEDAAGEEDGERARV